MRTTSLSWHLFFLCTGTFAACYISIFLSNILIPERSCLSIRGLLWTVVYMLFFVMSAIRLIRDKGITVTVLLRNFLICIVGPYVLLQLLKLI